MFKYLYRPETRYAAHKQRRQKRLRKSKVMWQIKLICICDNYSRIYMI